jgi:hypothetical protein
MVLTLSTRTTPEPRERLVIPACLQARAPLSYEIRDEHDRRIPPTLAGYKLRRGKTYRLLVRTQEKQPGNWSLRLLAPRSLLEVSPPDEIEGDGRVVTFHTRSPASGELWKWFGSRLTSIPVHLDFQDGREPYKFSIPIILRASRLRPIVSLVLTALLTVGSEAIFRERLAVPSWPHVAVIGGLWVLVVLLCISWDLWKFYRQAVRLLAGKDGKLGVEQPVKTSAERNTG